MFQMIWEAKEESLLFSRETEPMGDIYIYIIYIYIYIYISYVSYVYGEWCTHTVLHHITIFYPMTGCIDVCDSIKL
jgi:hypothetical protein